VQSYPMVALVLAGRPGAVGIFRVLAPKSCRNGPHALDWLNPAYRISVPASSTVWTVLSTLFK